MKLGELCDHSAVAGRRRIHALQGGGPGLKGKYLNGVTWCGVELRSKSLLCPTTQAVDCKTCLSRIRSFEAA